MKIGLWSVKSREMSGNFFYPSGWQPCIMDNEERDVKWSNVPNVNYTLRFLTLMYHDKHYSQTNYS